MTEPNMDGDAYSRVPAEVWHAITAIRTFTGGVERIGVEEFAGALLKLSRSE